MAIIGATLLQSFNKIEDRNVTTTMLTANLQRTVSSFFKGTIKEDKKEVVAGINYVFIVLATRYKIKANKTKKSFESDQK